MINLFLAINCLKNLLNFSKIFKIVFQTSHCHQYLNGEEVIMPAAWLFGQHHASYGAKAYTTKWTVAYRGLGTKYL